LAVLKPMVMMIVKLYCPECKFAKGRPLTKEILSPDERPVALGGRWHLDGLALQPSEGYDHLMVAIEAATKYIILRPCSLLMDIVRRFGRPREVTSDQGHAFKSEAFLKVCECLLIKVKYVGVGEPQANGMVERANTNTKS